MGFYINDGMLFLSRAGELARLSACGKDSIRFQSSANCVIADQDFTLMPQKIDAQITVNDDSAIMKNGDMEAKLYPNGRVEFYFKGRLILREKSELTFDAQIRNYRNKDSMLWKARVTFDANENEHFYGLGHEATDCFDLKGCTIDLRHVNAKCAIPYVY